MVELDYRLGRPHWGRGLATEGGRALLGMCFEEWDVMEVRATALAANARSLRVMRKLGT